MKWWNVMKWMKWMKWDEMDEGMKWDEIDEIWWNRRRNEITNYNNNMTNAQTLYYTLYNTFLLDLHACLPRTVSSVCFVLMCAVCSVFRGAGTPRPPYPRHEESQTFPVKQGQGLTERDTRRRKRLLSRLMYKRLLSWFLKVQAYLSIIHSRVSTEALVTSTLARVRIRGLAFWP